MCRLLADSIHDETVIRRSLILASINISIKDTLSSSTADEFLFGNKLSDNLKSAKIIEQSAQDLRAQKTSHLRSTKNFKGPSRSQTRASRTTNGPKSSAVPTYKSQRPRYRDQHREQTQSQRSHPSRYKSSHKNHSRRN